MSKSIFLLLSLISGGSFVYASQYSQDEGICFLVRVKMIKSREDSGFNGSVIEQFNKKSSLEDVFEKKIYVKENPRKITRGFVPTLNKDVALKKDVVDDSQQHQQNKENSVQDSNPYFKLGYPEWFFSDQHSGSAHSEPQSREIVIIEPNNPSKDNDTKKIIPEDIFPFEI